MRSPDGRRAFPWEALLLGLAAVGALLFQLTLPHHLASPADEAAALAQLTRTQQPGDVLLLQPWWTERVRLQAPEGLPVVGYLGSEADPLEDHPRIWVLTQPELPVARRAAFEQAFLPGRERVQGPERFGPLQLTLYRNGRYRRSRFTASESLAQSQPRMEQNGASAPCQPGRSGAWLCPPGIQVQTGWHELFYAPHRCIALEPPGGSAALVLSFPAVPATATLALEAGIVWEHAWKRDPGLSALDVELRAPGAPEALARLHVAPGTEGMQRLEVPGHAGPLEVRVTSANRKERQACVELKALDAPGGGT